MIARLLATLGSLAALSSPVTAMDDNASLEDTRALNLAIEEESGVLVVTLTGEATRARKVAYTLEVTGTSTSRHRGSTTLTAHQPAVLSTLKVTAGEDWCVRLTAEEDGLEPYEVIEGTCA